MAKDVILKLGACEARIAAHGAEIMEWRVGGRDLIWNGDARWWPRRSPILFPICGWTNGGKMRAKGREAACEVHSFGRNTDFSLQQISASEARLSLTETPATLAEFPYRFEVAVHVALTENGFSYDVEVSNPGDEVLPYALGFHPGFVWPFDGGEKSAYVIEFEKEEAPFSARIAPFGLFTSELLPLPLDGTRLDIFKALKKQESLFIRSSASEALAFVAPSGRKITVRTENYPNWVLWSKEGGAYLCIERWTGEGDPVGFTGEVIDKPGQTLMEPGGRQAYRFACAFV